MEEKVFVNTTVTLNMSKDVYLEMPANYTSEELKLAAISNVQNPDTIIKTLLGILSKHGIMIGGVEGWDISNITVSDNETGEVINVK